ncbi:MAG: hypothetical protein ACTHLO_01130 [Pseudolabrys sp.]
MPTSLPASTRIQGQRRFPAAPDILSGIGLGTAAVLLAVFVGWDCGDPVGAVLTLVMVGAVMCVLFQGRGAGRTADIDGPSP